jgi:hypothetical protein
MNLIRVWKEIDLDDIEKHILIADDLHGFCPGCKHTGIKYSEMKKCPGCCREFKYAATREKGDSAAGQLVINKIAKHCPDLIIIDYNDYKHHTDKQKAHNLFGNI